MKLKTSITLSEDVRTELDREAVDHASRSALIDGVLRKHFQEKIRQAIHARDVELINANADSLNREAMDVLRYQAPIDYTSED